MKVSNDKKQHIYYFSILIVVITSFVLLGNYNIHLLRQDYNSQISLLKIDVQVLEKNLVDKQQQIDELNSLVSETDQKIEDASTKYETGIKSLRETTQAYEMQIGELNQQISDLAVESESFSTIISQVIESVVSVSTNAGQGSGAIISKDGKVVTNYHVIKGATRASIITYGGDSYAVGLMGYNEKNDIAVLKMVTNDTFDYFDFGGSDNLKAGQKVVALGNPLGLSFTATEGIISSPLRLADDGLYYIQTDVSLNPVSKGIISGLSRSISAALGTKGEMEHLRGVLQTDVAINQGNSGGPLINSKGELIGINNFKVSGYEGLGFAIPSNRAQEVIEEILYG